MQYSLHEKGIKPEIKIAKNISHLMTQEKTVIFLEHYPFRSKEENFIADWEAEKIYVLSSLDEPLFEQFGGEKIISLMKQMGLKDDEMIEHSLVSKSIVNAQLKLEKKVGVEITAQSAKEWFKKNKKF
jgi:hypothetical protein